MLRTLLLLFLPAFYGHLAFSQKAFSIPININSQTRGDYQKTVDLTSEKPNDFFAVSLRLNGRNVHNVQVTYTLTTKKKKYTFVPYGHHTFLSQDTFVSEIIYLDPLEAGILHFEMSAKDSIILSDNAVGFLRVFIPESTNTENNDLITHESNQPIYCPCPKPAYIPRSNWGNAYLLDSDIYIAPPTYTTVTHLIVHHSAGTNTNGNWKNIVASIFDFHVYTNGWQDIGYNWLIDPTGVLYEGRGGGENVRGAHMCSYNNNTMGVCMLGNYESTEPTDEMMTTLRSLLAYKACKEGISADGSSNILSHTGHMHHISGHKEGCSPNYTECPGKFLFSKMELIRTETKNYMTSGCSELSNSDVSEIDFTSLYPVPAADYICHSTLDVVQIMDLQGQNITGQTKRLDSKCIDISALNNGLYLMIYKNENRIVVRKFLKI